MAILKQTVHVKSQGATGWTDSDVLDALETVFTNLGMNNGTALTGVPHVIYAPDNDVSSFTDHAYNNSSVQGFEECGGGQIEWWNSGTNGSGPVKTIYYYVYNDSNNGYRVLEESRFEKSNVYDSSHGTRPNQIYIQRHGLSNGDLRTYAATSNLDANDRRIGGLTPGDDYYIIKVDEDHIKLETSVGNGEIPLSTPTTTGSNLFPYYFRQKNDASNNNNTIRAKMGDTLSFVTSNISSIDNGDSSGITGTFNLLKDTNQYDATKLLEAESGATYANDPTNNGDDTSITSWNTLGYYQTENEALFPDRGPGEGTGTNLDDYGIVKYIYANSDIANNPNMFGEIILEPWAGRSYSDSTPYWKYTVSGSAVDAIMGDNAGRTDLKLRVYRRSTGATSSTGKVCNITIHSIAQNWSTADQFTIPGEEVGGKATINDIKFGTMQADNVNYNGTCQLNTNNFGSGSNFFQKSTSGQFAVAKVVHDGNKTFGTTFYTFGMPTTDKYKFTLQSGNTWRFINHIGINYSTNSSNDDYNSYYGKFSGVPGLDYQSSDYGYQIRRNRSSDQYFVNLQYATSQNPTNYPLEIRTYRAQSPQDTDFAIIQFVQVINSNVSPFATFSISRGSQHGSGIYDLNHVHQDSILEIMHGGSGSRALVFRYGNTNRGSGTTGVNEPVSLNTVARAASYGYLRDESAQYRRAYVDTEFVSNIDTNSSADSHEIRTYYRNSNFDDVPNTGIGLRHKGKKVNPAADYYKPMSGLPVSTGIFPIPYYLPDDFVMLQVAASPGETTFRTGDTVTINSGSEVYEIIRASYQTNQTGLDGGLASYGILFMARTT